MSTNTHIVRSADSVAYLFVFTVVERYNIVMTVMKRSKKDAKAFGELPARVITDMIPAKTHMSVSVEFNGSLGTMP
jgi:hypothetical protein